MDVSKLKNVLDALGPISQGIAALIDESGMGGGFNADQVARGIQLVDQLAETTIQAVHDAKGVEVTPDSVLALIYDEGDLEAALKTVVDAQKKAAAAAKKAASKPGDDAAKTGDDKGAGQTSAPASQS